MALRRPWFLLASIPIIAIGVLLWVDEFNLGAIVFFPKQLASNLSPAQDPVADSGSNKLPVAGAELPEIVPMVVGDGVPEIMPLPLLLSTPTPSASHEKCVTPSAAASLNVSSLRGSRKPLVGMSIAVHPPKFYAAAKFLEQYASCPEAVRALAVYIVFTDEKDSKLFQELQACLSPDVPQDAWTPVVSIEPKGGWRGASGAGNQIIAAYKKWHGITYMMDQGKDGPAYGLMVDSELLLYDSLGEDERGTDCLPGGPWHALFERIQAQDFSKTFPAARVSSTLTTYTFGGRLRSGQDYDRSIIRDNAHFAGGQASIIAGKNKQGTCITKGCEEVRRQIEDCLFSWWTDLPWLNLTVAGKMLAYVGGMGAEVSADWRPPKGWRKLSTGIRFTRFEYLAYQQWCVLTEGFHFRDVTEITGEAKWGSYMEDPIPGARLGELQPIWISGQALERVESGVLPKLSQEVPPLIIFHADQGRSRAGRERIKALWLEVLLAFLKRDDRKDFSKESLN